jgi:hypothetical protein
LTTFTERRLFDSPSVKRENVKREGMRRTVDGKSERLSEKVLMTMRMSVVSGQWSVAFGAPEQLTTDD